MKRGKEIRGSTGQPIGQNAPNEVPALMFVMVEQSPGAFTLRMVRNDDLLRDLAKQGALKNFLLDIDRLYADFRGRFGDQSGRELPEGTS